MKPAEHLETMIAGLAPEDYALACDILSPHYAELEMRYREPGGIWHPDLVIAPDGKPYLYRWYLMPCGGYYDREGRKRPIPEYRNSVMLHIQVQSDPERPLHDHPWDNQSVILAGGYEEIIQSQPPYGTIAVEQRKVGDVITRAGTEAHRLVLPPGVPYAMTVFSTGPKVRDWGFWYGTEWHHNKRHVEMREDGVSVHVNR